MKLRNRILLPVIIILTAVVAAISIANYLITRDNMTGMIDTEMEASISSVSAAEKLSEEIIGLVMDELDSKNLSLSRALAEILRLNPEALETEEMVRLAKLLGVSEVNVIDGEGILNWGSVPAYFGLDFDSGGQTRPFLEILEDPSFELAQEPQPNEALGKMLQYAGVARTDEKGFVQVGIEAGVIDALIAAMDIQETISETKVGRSGFCFITEDGIITASADESQIGASFSSESVRQTGEGGWITLNGQEYYAHSREASGKTIYAAIPRSEFFEGLNTLAVSSVIVSAAAIIIMVFVMTLILRKITRPMEELNGKLKTAAEGDLSVSVTINSRDEIGMLSASMAEVIEVFKRLADDTAVMLQKHNDEGDIDYRIDESRYSGDYGKVVWGLNETVKRYNQESLDLAAVLQNFGAGNFTVSYPMLPGKKAASNQAVEEVRKHLTDIGRDIKELATEAAAGNTEIRADEGKYKGDWAALLTGLNSLVESVADKNIWYESILDSIPMPIFVTDKKLNWLFLNKGMEKLGVANVKEAVGKQCCNLGTKICGTGGCAIKNFMKGKTPTVFEQDGVYYQVSVGELKDKAGKPAGYLEVILDVTGMEKMIDNLNELVGNVKLISEEVRQGSKQIAENSQTLAEGSANQTSSVQELNSSIVLINERIQENADNSSNASRLTSTAKQHVLDSSAKMKDMLSAMGDIKTASTDISKIIKSIEDISFQTNLLALNASVEASRAGVHGKGFAVVAEEVRSLAIKSQTAARETSDLISESINKVENGVTIAETTAKSLNAFVSDFDAVSNLIEEIAAASTEQAQSIEQITNGIAQISDVTQGNSASSEEMAAASQELAGQADILQDMVNAY